MRKYSLVTALLFIAQVALVVFGLYCFMVGQWLITIVVAGLFVAELTVLRLKVEELVGKRKR